MSIAKSMSIASVVRAAAERFGARVAVRDDARSLTFAALSDRVHGMAAGLAGHGIPPNATVAVLLPNSVAAVEVDLALTIGGYVRVALNPRVGPRAWAPVRPECRPAALIVDPAVEGAAEFARAADTPVIVPNTGRTTDIGGDGSSGRNGTPGEFVSLEDIIASAPPRVRLPEPAPD